MRTPVSEQGAKFVVADIGGTTLRIGTMQGGQEEVFAIKRFRTESLRVHLGESGQELQDRIVRQLVRELKAYLESTAGKGAVAVGLSFAGPISRAGVVKAAPTLWGPGARPLLLTRVLEDALGLSVVVANDITAAAWRYADSEAKPFCLITVSSGIGNKVFWGRDVLVDEDGHGGELGHWHIDVTEPPLRCDCGEYGHLGAVASGRGVVALAELLAQRHSKRFLASVLNELSGGRPGAITSVDVAAAVRSNDPFAIHILQQALRPLASALVCLFAAIGVRRFLFIGGFALAVGQQYIDLLGDELVKLGCFGLREPEVRTMLALGAADDEHSLLGMGRMLSTGLLAREQVERQNEGGAR